jgi:hypothetical protein
MHPSAGVGHDILLESKKRIYFCAQPISSKKAGQVEKSPGIWYKGSRQNTAG